MSQISSSRFNKTSFLITRKSSLKKSNDAIIVKSLITTSSSALSNIFISSLLWKSRRTRKKNDVNAKINNARIRIKIKIKIKIKKKKTKTRKTTKARENQKTLMRIHENQWAKLSLRIQFSSKRSFSRNRSILTNSLSSKSLFLSSSKLSISTLSNYSIRASFFTWSTIDDFSSISSSFSTFQSKT